MLKNRQLWYFSNHNHKIVNCSNTNDVYIIYQHLDAFKCISKRWQKIYKMCGSTFSSSI